MKISTEIYASINDGELTKILDSNELLKGFVNMEIERMKDEGLIKSCGSGCGRGCCSSSCGHKESVPDAAFMTAALVSIFNYYIPDNIKNAIHMASSTVVDDCNED